jgi:hypothetical protein
MPRVIPVDDSGISSLEECTEALCGSGFDPGDEESLAHAALQLRRLGNNRTFLGDRLIDELALRHREGKDENSYGPQVIMLFPPSERSFFLRANIWPSEDEHSLRASGGSSFVYGLPHDHNFSFLTLGYFGPGYWSSYYEYDYEPVEGWTGEPVNLRFVERSRLEEGKIQLYRAHLDVHAQAPADSLSVSLNVMYAHSAHAWYDQYSFDLENRKVARILSHGSSEAFVRIAVGLGGEEAVDLAQRFGRTHPSDRMRLVCWDALAAAEPEPGRRDAIWREAEAAGSRLVAGEARSRRGELAEAS